jgi:hypothetical protein
VTAFAIDRIFQDGLAAGLARNRLGAVAPAIVASCPREVRQELSALMAEAIAQEIDPAEIEIESSGAAAAPAEQLRSAIFHSRTGGETHSITFLRVKDAALETIVPLVSMALAAWSGDMKAAVPALQSVTALWKNLVVLRRETDGCAMEVYEALVAAKAANRAAKEGSPTTSAIAGRMPARSSADINSALKRLADLKLIEAAHWGGADGDLAHENNAWKVRL